MAQLDRSNAACPVTHPTLGPCTRPADHRAADPADPHRYGCPYSGRDWAGRYQRCTLTPGHPGRCIGSTGATIDRKGRGY